MNNQRDTERKPQLVKKKIDEKPKDCANMQSDDKRHELKRIRRELLTLAKRVDDLLAA